LLAAVVHKYFHSCEFHLLCGSRQYRLGATRAFGTLRCLQSHPQYLFRHEVMYCAGMPPGPPGLPGPGMRPMPPGPMMGYSSNAAPPPMPPRPPMMPSYGARYWVRTRLR